MADDPFPRIVTVDDLRYQIAFVIGQTPRHVLRDWIGNDRLRSSAARERVVEAICARLEGLQIRGPAAAPGHSVPPT